MVMESSSLRCVLKIDFPLHRHRATMGTKLPYGYAMNASGVLDDISSNWLVLFCSFLNTKGQNNVILSAKKAAKITWNARSEWTIEMKCHGVEHIKQTARTRRAQKREEKIVSSCCCCDRTVFCWVSSHNEILPEKKNPPSSSIKATSLVLPSLSFWKFF